VREEGEVVMTRDDDTKQHQQLLNQRRIQDFEKRRADYAL